jgi:N-methylhydantoinase A
LRIAATAMSHAVKAVTTERGLDAGKFTMIVYGGAGPLHASAIAREIGIRKVLIPYAPGYFSAYGMLFGDLRYDYVRSCFRKLAGVPFEELESIYAAMEAEGRAQIASSRVHPTDIVVTRAADMRYVGQEHAVTVDLDGSLFERQDRDGVKAEFDRVHEVRYGTCAPSEPADLVSLRVTVTGLMRKPPMAPLPAADKGADAAVRGVKPVYFRDAGDFVPTMVFKRDLLRPGHTIEGPALIEEHASTTVVQPGDVLHVDVYGNLHIAIGE